ncbi:MAG: cell division ATP-binding protein FtsE [Firmicutes bacterium]|nr:cell division ATP-binding protein FtsE [Bacillota bacterium]
MICLNDVTKIYDNQAKGIENVSLSIKQGEFVFIVGTSGSGKSTFIRLLLKEVDLTSGEIIVSRQNLSLIHPKLLPYYRRNIGVVFQDFKLLPNKTVYENVAFAMEIVQASSKDIRRSVPAVLSMVGLEKKYKDYPNQLSGGEKQRTAIARAIVNKPPLLLADEPTGNLDPDNALEIMKLLEKINSHGTTVIVATHAKDLVDSMKKRVITFVEGNLISDVEQGVYDYEVAQS